MVLGILLIAMVAALGVAVTLFLLSAPLWIALLAYPLTGALAVFAGLALLEVRDRRRSRGDERKFLARVTSRFRAGQRPR
ncbi:hypothetical protein [Tabrizicola soli]|uniref:Uncharacterized protein n=1 Tax=Tabrizicola soli TaxID=2185115 RepID=A0ABV7DT12_9RHOB|nr:hypothetical protein [Tabrizicola soli]